MPPSTKTVATKAVVRVHESRLKRKKKHDGGGGGHEGGGMMRWLLTYADMITLLLALFIILFAISTPNKVKYDELVKELSGGFGSDSPINTPTSGSKDGRKTSGAKEKSLHKLQMQLSQFIKQNHLEKQVKLHSEARGLVVSLLTDKALYDSGSANLRPQTQSILTHVGGFLKNLPADIRVEGNTDNIPIATAEYPSNWELSAARAVTVTRYLTEREHLDARRFSAAGYGQYKPQGLNDTEAHRQLNRRVDIVILNTSPGDAARE